MDYVEYRIVRKDGAIRWIEERTRQLTEKAALINEKKQNEQKIQTLMEEYDKERRSIYGVLK